MIKIGIPKVIEVGNKARLICDILVDEDKKEVYLEVDLKYGKYLCTERADAFLIVLFYYGMVHNHDITSEVCVSEDLYYQIREYLMPVLLEKGNGKLNKINIDCATGDNMTNEGGVVTGLTCGVDSFHAILNNIDSEYKSKKLTHLIIMSLADSYKKNGNYDLITNKLYEQARLVSDELKIPLIEINSNIRELFPIPPMHTLIRTFGVYALQKLFSVYYFASGFPVWTFNINDSVYTDSARYDLFLCKELSTRNLTIYSEGAQKNRYDKLDFIVDNEIVKKNLHVCVIDHINCGECSKCIRTMCALDCMGKLDEYRLVFDVDKYYNNIDYYLEKVIDLYKSRDIFIYEYIDKLFDKYKDNHIVSEFLKNNSRIGNGCDRCYKLADYIRGK